MKIKCLAELFFEQGFYFKYEDHEKIAKGFDAGSIVRFQEYDNFKDVYGTHTVVTFSDGSAVSFNYKGEIDWLNEQTLGDEIDELNQEKLYLQEQLDSIWSILEGSNASGKEVEEIAKLLDLKWSNHYGWEER
jgi:hypothetical protein